jgi:RNA polymerase sigma-54 factor
VERRGLDDHLRDQVALLDLTPRQLLLSEEFIGNIDENGWLTCTLEELLAAINEVVTQAAEDLGREDDVPLYTLAEAEEMLGIMQVLDPPGVGARTLQECLIIQLRDGKREETLAGRLVRDAFDELINHRWSEISRRFGVTVAEVQDAADEVAKLDPKPGLRYSEATDNYIIPDLVVDRIDGSYHVFINDANLPRLRLSRIYQEIARDRRKFDGENKEFISSKLNSANWMIQAIEQRRQTMLKVTNFIVDRQRDFLEKGIQYLRPLTLREVAEHIGMHESTVSRVTNEKFVQTPRGVLPLKFFFSSGLSTTGGEDVSARGIKDTIAKLVGGEDPKNPLTDQAIVAILKDQGVNIARRTVAKYRDQLGVLSARMRRRV